MRCFFMIFFFMLIFFQKTFSLVIENAEQITEEWLINETKKPGYTNHVIHFKELFKKIKVKTFLEFGLGFSTKYFIDNCEKVISVEFVTPLTGPKWIKYCIDLYRNYNTWIPIAYFSGKGIATNWATNKYIGKNSVYEAVLYQRSQYRNYALIDPSYLKDLNNFINKIKKDNQIEVAFVDPGVIIRGDLVQLLFDKVPIIVAHDIYPISRKKENVYGYDRIVVPKNYIELFCFPSTAFWIKKEGKYLEIIKHLEKYINNKKMYPKYYKYIQESELNS